MCSWAGPDGKIKGLLHLGMGCGSGGHHILEVCLEGLFFKSLEACSLKCSMQKLWPPGGAAWLLRLRPCLPAHA